MSASLEFTLSARVGVQPSTRPISILQIAALRDAAGALVGGGGALCRCLYRPAVPDALLDALLLG
jgi:hypothetical protein